MEKISASEASGMEEREEPATIRMALFTNSANVKREVQSSIMLYFRQNLMADKEGLYGAFWLLGVSSSMLVRALLDGGAGGV